MAHFSIITTPLVFPSGSLFGYQVAHFSVDKHTGHWDSGKSSFDLIAQALQGHSLHAFGCAPLYLVVFQPLHALVSFLFQV